MTMYKMIADGTQVAMTAKEEKEHVTKFFYNNIKER